MEALSTLLAIWGIHRQLDRSFKSLSHLRKDKINFFCVGFTYEQNNISCAETQAISRQNLATNNHSSALLDLYGSLMDSPDEGPLMRKMCQIADVIMQTPAIWKRRSRRQL